MTSVCLFLSGLNQCVCVVYPDESRDGIYVQVRVCTHQRDNEGLTDPPQGVAMGWSNFGLNQSWLMAF